MAMTIRTLENRFYALLALHELVFKIEENNEGELEFMEDNPTLNAFINDCKNHLLTESDIIYKEITRHSLKGEFPQFQGLMDSIFAMATGDSVESPKTSKE